MSGQFCVHGRYALQLVAENHIGSTHKTRRTLVWALFAQKGTFPVTNASLLVHFLLGNARFGVRKFLPMSFKG
jgi:hypothetical protein